MKKTAEASKVVTARRALTALALASLGACSWFSGQGDKSYTESEPSWEEMAPPPPERPVEETPPAPAASEPVPAEPVAAAEAAPEAAPDPSTGTATEPVAEAAASPAPAPAEVAAAETPVPEAAPAAAEPAAEKTVIAKPAAPAQQAPASAAPPPAAPAQPAPAPVKAAEAPPAAPPPPVAEAPAPRKPFVRPLNRDVEPVLIVGEQLGPFLGRPISSIRLHAIRARGIEPIPLQIDERHPKGEYVFTDGPDKDHDKDRGLFDANDELVFMAFDLGDRLENLDAFPAHKGNRPAVIRELVIRDPVDGKRGYAYLTAWDGEAPAYSRTDYVTYKVAEDLVEATSFAIGFNKDTPFAIDRASVRLPNGKFSENRVDILKIRLTSTFFRFYDFNRNQTDFGSKTAAWIDGPVRAILHKGISIRMILGLQSPKIWNDTVFYPYGLEYGFDIWSPFAIGTVASKFEMYSGMDFRDLRGGTFYTNGMDKPLTITGNPKNPEIAKVNAIPEENRFAAIGWENSYFLMRINIPPEIPIKLHAYLVDDPDLIDAPERFPGAVPGMYFRMEDWLKVKQTKFSIVTSVHVTDTFTPGQEKLFFTKLDKPPALEKPLE